MTRLMVHLCIYEQKVMKKKIYLWINTADTEFEYLFAWKFELEGLSNIQISL